MCLSVCHLGWDLERRGLETSGQGVYCRFPKTNKKHLGKPAYSEIGGRGSVVGGYSVFFLRQGQGLYYQRLLGASREINKPYGVSACHQTKIETAAAPPADAPSLHHNAQCINLSIHPYTVCPNW